MKRSEAANLLDRIRELVAEGRGPADMAELLLNYGIPPLRKCTGEAHGNAYIDNCSVCMPRWGWVGRKVKIT